MTKNSKIAAIFFAVFNESNLIEKEKNNINNIIAENNGKIIESNDVALNASFPEADAAVDAALELQDFMTSRNISIRIGLHFASNTSKNFIVAYRIAEKTQFNQIMLTENFFIKLSNHYKSQASFVSKIIGCDENPLSLYTFNKTVYDSNKHLKLLLSHKNQETILIGLYDYVLGKSDDCDLVIKYSEASDHHAVITRKKDSFIIKDMSEKGTYIKAVFAIEESFIKNEETALCDTGVISLGGSLKDNKKEIIKYKVIKS
ncbi:MAG: FHA domain-containing protein [Alphaproteobacteria bacterium]